MVASLGARLEPLPLARNTPPFGALQLPGLLTQTVAVNVYEQQVGAGIGHRPRIRGLVVIGCVRIGHQKRRQRKGG